MTRPALGTACPEPHQGRAVVHRLAMCARPRPGATAAAPGRGRRSRAGSGFTLLELMVALAILAIALPAVMRAVGAATAQVDELRLRTLAGWVADNRLAEHRARRDWLPLGRQEGVAEQGGMRFGWVEEVQATPNAQFRRVDLSVWLLPEHGGGPDRVLGRLSGFVTAPGGGP